MWTAFDYLLAGGMVAGLALAATLILRLNRSLFGRIGFAVTAGTAALLLFATGAVGLIGAETNPANHLYLGLVALVAVGAVAVRFRAAGMARVTLAAALGQVAIATAETFGAMEQGPALWVLKTWAVTALFAGLWSAAALAFTLADRAMARAPAP